METQPIRDPYGENPEWIEKIEKPAKITFKNVMYWEPVSHELRVLGKNGSVSSATLLTKAHKFLENECIIQTPGGFLCKPIKGYNNTTYKITILPSGEFQCNCQGWTKALKDHNKGFCSHCLAVIQFRFIK